MNELFRKLAATSANALGSPLMFVANVALLFVWLGAGTAFHFSDTWQLVANTIATILTYLAVFLIQNTQNRDAKAVHLKLDELISSMEGARNRLVKLENLSDADLEILREEFARLHEKERGSGRSDAVRGEPGT